MDPLLPLLTLRYKGRADAALLAAVAGTAELEAAEALAAAVQAGHAAPAGQAFKLTPDGKAELGRLQQQERAGVDPAAVQALYDRFSEVNDPLKGVITLWQLRDGAPNDHSDAGYDAGVVERLVAVHEQASPVLGDLADFGPRFARYPARFEDALRRVQGGDTTYIARPITDSYHTIWFELHEDLIVLAGLTRADEAAAGRAH